jgi:hypothetical protein
VEPPAADAVFTSFDGDLGGKTVSAATTTTDHDTIRRWAEERGGHPATVGATREGDEAGILRIDFESTQAEGLERISWEQFFRTFEESELAFLYQDETESGGTSRFFKLVRRD